MPGPGPGAGAGPVRTCVGCRSRRPAGNLVRVARQPDGSLVVSRAAPGRGAWLCREACSDRPVLACLDQAVRRKAFSRAFRAEVAAGALAALREHLLEREIM